MAMPDLLGGEQDVPCVFHCIIGRNLCDPAGNLQLRSTATAAATTATTTAIAIATGNSGMPRRLSHPGHG